MTYRETTEVQTTETEVSKDPHKHAQPCVKLYKQSSLDNEVTVQIPSKHEQIKETSPEVDILKQASSEDNTTEQTPQQDTCKPTSPEHDSSKPTLPDHDIPQPTSPEHDIPKPVSPEHDISAQMSPELQTTQHDTPELAHISPEHDRNKHDTPERASPEHDTPTQTSPEHDTDKHDIPERTSLECDTDMPDIPELTSSKHEILEQKTPEHVSHCDAIEQSKSEFEKESEQAKTEKNAAVFVEKTLSGIGQISIELRQETPSLKSEQEEDKMSDTEPTQKTTSLSLHDLPNTPEQTDSEAEHPASKHQFRAFHSKSEVCMQHTNFM